MSAGWALLIIAILAGIAFVSYMRRLFRQSEEARKRIDPSKLREWKDED